MSKLQVRRTRSLKLAANITDKSCMIALYPGRKLQKTLHVPEGEEKKDLHLTVVYLGDVENGDLPKIVDAVKKVAGTTPVQRIRGNIAGGGLFTKGERPVSYASVDAPALPELRQKLVDGLKQRNIDVPEDHGFTPHMTLKYGDDVDFKNITNTQVNFGSLHVVRGNVTVAKVPLEDAKLTMSQQPEDSFDFEKYELHLATARKQAAKNLIAKGNTNRKAVRALQTRLSNLGYAVSNDGIFGEETEKALRKFQKSRNAEVDGVVGTETLGKLTRATPNKPKTDEIGIDSIAAVVDPTGISGEPQSAKRSSPRVRSSGSNSGGNSRVGSRIGGTARETGRSGSEASDPAEPKIDPATGAPVATSSTGPIGSTDPDKPTQVQDPEFEKLHPREGGKFVKKGDTGQPTTNTQKALNKTGAHLQTDGIFGNKTESAVKQFQKKHGLAVDGIVGARTSRKLRVVIKKKRTTKA